MKKVIIALAIFVGIIAVVLIYGGLQIKENERAIAQVDAFLQEYEEGGSYED